VIIEAIKQLVEQDRHLSREQARGAFDDIMAGRSTPAQIGALLTALRIRGETVEEIAGAADAMRSACVRVDPGPGPVVDTCGTGGDGAKTFNISTAAAIVAAGAGVKVAKHGNRSVTGVSGSADVLVELGVRIDAAPATVQRCIQEVGIGFLFAPAFHQATKHAAGPRKELGFRTVFNILGPLTNPAGADRQVIGVARPELTEPLAQVLRLLGIRRAMVLCSTDGLDEISDAAPCRVTELKDDKVATFEFDPRDLGFEGGDRAALRADTPQQSAEAIRDVLAGSPGPRRDIVLLNAAAALRVADASTSWADGLKKAEAAIDSGKAGEVLQRWVIASRFE